MRLSPPASDPVHRTQQIYAAIQGRIASGSLAPGAPLPSTRALAAEWGVSRTTVTAAYEQLIAEGYVEARQGARSRVAAGLAPPRAKADQPDAATAPVRLSAFGQRLGDLPAPPLSSPERLVADFRYGDLAAADFPLPAWKRAIQAALVRRHPHLRYGDAAGLEDLRVALQGYLWRARGVRCEVGQIIVVNGAQQGLDLCVRLLLDAGDWAVMEEPGYGLARQVFQAAGAQVVPVPVDGEGLRTEAMPAARLAYVTPAHQFPLGCIMSVARRQGLIAWAERVGAHIIEDDYDSEYRFDVGPIPPLHSLDGGRRVLYLGTVSKTLSPTLRLGYLVVPPALAGAFTAAKRLADRHTSTLEQAALASLMESGVYERHVRRVRRRNAERRMALLAALRARLGGAITVVGAEAGLHVVIWLHRVPVAREADFIAAVRALGVGVYPISQLYGGGAASGRPDSAGLVMGYATLEPQAIAQGVGAIARVLDVFTAGEAPVLPGGRS